MDLITFHLCSIQARLFELSVDKGYDSKNFITEYMNSDIARHFNSSYDDLQWRGEEYILDYMNDECNLIKGETYSKDEMFWIGYIYCYWHFKTNETCKTIYNTASPEVMRSTYLGFHTISNDLAIENLMEIDIRKKIKKLNKNTFQYIMKDEVEVLLNLYSKKNESKVKIEQVEYIDEFIDENKRKFITEVIDLIEESDWPLRKKTEYRVILELLYDDIINNGFNDVNYKFITNIYNTLNI